MTTRVLVVEDEQEAALLFRDLLRQFGYDPRLTGSAEGACVELDVEPPDAILLDLYLPAMTGLDFLRLPPVRESNIPIIAVSGVATESEARECLRLGALDFIPKPVAPDLLQQVLLYAEVRILSGRLDEAGRPVERRRSLRRGLGIPVRAVERDGGEWKGTCIDLSVFGARIRPHEPISPGPTVKLSLTPPDGGTPLNLLAIPVRRDADGHSFRFVNLTRDDFERLRALIR